MVERVLEQAATGEVEATLRSSREARLREWQAFQADNRARLVTPTECSF